MKKYLKLLIALGVVFILGEIIYLSYPKLSKQFSSYTEQRNKEKAIKNAPKAFKVGESIKGNKFEITINSIKTANAVNTGNQFTSLPKKSGQKYLILDLTFKNIDKETRTVTDEGEIAIFKEGWETLTIDRSEVVMREDIGILLQHINPTMTRNFKLIYAIPDNFIGFRIGYFSEYLPLKTYIDLGNL